MRDKLIELIKKGGVIIPETAEAVADYLIANNVFVLPDEVRYNLELFLMDLYLNSEEEIEETKEIFELSQKKQILTEIREYLVTEKGRIANSDMFILQIQAVEKFADKAIADLTEYAEKLGVEL